MTNIVHPSFKHGKNFKIGYYNIIGENIIVGDNVTIENHVVLKSNSIIGDNVFIDSHVKSSGQNIIGNGTKLRFGASIGRELTIGKNCFISPHVVILYQKHTQEGCKTIIGDNCFIGTSAVVGPGVTIAPGVVIGAMAYVAKDCLKSSGVYVGIPACKIK